jgi:hypothetical protein
MNAGAVFRAAALIAAMLGLTVGEPGRAQAQSADLTSILDTLRWGASAQEVLDYHREQERQAYRARIESISDPLMVDRLSRESDQVVQRIADSHETFSEFRTGYEVSVIRGEVVGDRGMSMLTVRQPSGNLYFIFHEDRLAKLILVMDQASQGYIGFEGFVERLAQALGRPENSESTVDELGIRRMQRASWSDGTTRLRVEDRTAMFSAYLLVYTDLAVEEIRIDAHEMAEAMRPTGARNSVSELVRRSSEAAPRGDRNENIVDAIVGPRPSGLSLGSRSTADSAADDAPPTSGVSALVDEEVLEDAPRLVRERRPAAAPGRTAPGTSAPRETRPTSSGTDIY